MALETLRATSSDSFPANLQSMIPGSASSAWVALLDLFAEIILRDQGKVNLFGSLHIRPRRLSHYPVKIMGS